MHFRNLSLILIAIAGVAVWQLGSNEPVSTGIDQTAKSAEPTETVLIQADAKFAHTPEPYKSTSIEEGIQVPSEVLANEDTVFEDSKTQPLPSAKSIKQEPPKVRVRITAAEGDWTGMLEVLDELNKVPVELLAEALKQAIEFNAPVHVFEDLIYRGAIFDHSHLYQLVRNNNVALTQSLVPLGLDIHMEDPDGANGIHMVFTKLPNKEMFGYLVDSKLNLTKKVNGQDPLAKLLGIMLAIDQDDSTSLTQAQNYILAQSYGKRLTDEGVQLEPEHHELLRQIVIANGGEVTE